MPLDPFHLSQTIDQVIGDTPHPDAPTLRVKDYQAHETVAAMMKNPDEATADDVVAAYHLLQQANLSPAEFEHTWEVARPVANQFLDRDPRPQELARFAGLTPSDIHDYYAGHPHPDHPEVRAGEYMRYFHAATPIAQMTVGRKPLPVEIARFAAAGYQSEDMLNHYTQGGEGGNADRS